MSGFLKGAGRVALWSAGGLAAYLVLEFIEPAGRPWALAFVLVLFLNYEVGTLKDRISDLEARLSSLSRRIRD